MFRCLLKPSVRQLQMRFELPTVNPLPCCSCERFQSRFSAEDILGGEESPFSEVQPSRTNTPGTGNSGSQGSKPSGNVPSSVKESKPFIDEVFGPSASNTPVNGGNATTVARTSSTAGSGSPKPASTPAGNSPSANPSSASPRPVNAFEDVTADLESRARSALSRAQSSLQGKAADATETVKESLVSLFAIRRTPPPRLHLKQRQRQLKPTAPKKPFAPSAKSSIHSSNNHHVVQAASLPACKHSSLAASLQRFLTRCQPAKMIPYSLPACQELFSHSLRLNRAIDFSRFVIGGFGGFAFIGADLGVL